MKDLFLLATTFADRGRDWEDVRGILIRQGAKLNLDALRQEVSEAGGR